MLAGTGGIPWSAQHHFGLPLSSLIDFGDSQLEAIPTVGFSDPILSYFSALRFVFDGLSMLQYGYEKVSAFCLYNIVILPCTKLTLQSDFQKGRGLFKIATFRRWMVLASSPQLIEDVKKAPEDILSLSIPRTEASLPPRALMRLIFI